MILPLLTNFAPFSAHLEIQYQLVAEGKMCAFHQICTGRPATVPATVPVRIVNSKSNFHNHRSGISNRRTNVMTIDLVSDIVSNRRTNVITIDLVSDIVSNRRTNVMTIDLVSNIISTRRTNAMTIDLVFDIILHRRTNV